MNGTGRPKLLYRYRPFGFPGDERELAVFNENILYFPKRSQFNDPLDCTPPSLLATREELEAFIDGRTEEEFPELTAEQQQEKALELKQCAPEELYRFARELAEHFGILSLASRSDNSPLWSHYTNVHRGFCLEFDASKEPFTAAHEVRYTRRRPPFDLSLDSAAYRANAENFVLTKHIDWQYEGEWRVIIPWGGASYPLPPEALTGVIFGLAISSADRNRVMSSIELGRCRPAIYEAKVNEKKFGFDIERLS